jgi:hypothetical protein
MISFSLYVLLPNGAETLGTLEHGPEWARNRRVSVTSGFVRQNVSSTHEKEKEA